MSVHDLNWIDYTILGIVLFSTLISLVRGFVREALSLIIWGAAFWIAYQFGGVFSNQFAGAITGEGTRHLLGFGAVFVITLIMGTIVNYFMGCLVYQTGLSGIDRLLGLVFGAGRGILLVAILLLCAVLTDLNHNPAWADSQVLPHFNGLVNWLYGILPEKIDMFAKVAEQKVAEQLHLPDDILSDLKGAVLKNPLSVAEGTNTAGTQ